MVSTQKTIVVDMEANQVFIAEDIRNDPQKNRRRDELSRRHACNRCRAHKLRCDRQSEAANNTLACKRCMRLRVECITSPGSKMGRPRTISNRYVPDIPTPSHQVATPRSDSPFDPDHELTFPNSTFDFIHKDILDGNDSTAMPLWLADSNFNLHSEPGPLIVDTLEENLMVTPDEPHIPEPTPAVSLTEKFLHTLSRLNEDLLKQVYAISSEGTPSGANINASTNRDRIRTADPSNNHFSKIVSNSQRFLDVMQPFMGPPQRGLTTSTTPQHPTSCDIRQDSLLQIDPLKSSIHPPLELDMPFTQSNSQHKRQGGRNQNRTFTSPTDLSLPSATHYLHRRSSEDEEDDTNTDDDEDTILHPDVPTAMTIMSCFCSLNRIYRIMFTRIESALMTKYFPSSRTTPPHSASSSSSSISTGFGNILQRPNTHSTASQSTGTTNSPITPDLYLQNLPTLNVDGFGIVQSHQLQVQVLLQVSTDLLDRIYSVVDTVLVADSSQSGSSSRTCSSRKKGGLFSAKTFHSIMAREAVTEETGEGGLEGGGYGCGKTRKGETASLKEKVRNVKRLLGLGVG